MSSILNAALVYNPVHFLLLFSLYSLPILSLFSSCCSTHFWNSKDEDQLSALSKIKVAIFTDFTKTAVYTPS